VLNTPTSGAGGRSCAEYANLEGGRTVLCRVVRALCGYERHKHSGMPPSTAEYG